MQDRDGQGAGEAGDAAEPDEVWYPLYDDVDRRALEAVEDQLRGREDDPADDPDADPVDGDADGDADGQASRSGRPSRSDEVWARVRRDYLAGDTAGTVADRYGMARSTVHDRARRGEWRRCDQPPAEPVDLAAEEVEGLPDYAVMARHALVRLNRAVMAGRAAEAGSWMRLHQRLLDLARLAAEAAAPPPPEPEPEPEPEPGTGPGPGPGPDPEPDPNAALNGILDAMTLHLQTIGGLAHDVARDDLDDPLAAQAMRLRLDRAWQVQDVLFPHTGSAGRPKGGAGTPEPEFPDSSDSFFSGAEDAVRPGAADP